jgi:hypothetical protein
MSRVIDTAYEAFQFLRDHPAFSLRERHEIPAEDFDKMLALGFLVSQDRSGKCWRQLRHLHRHALDTNLVIFYTKVDESGHVNVDKTKNVKVECWLEFGPEAYDYDGDGFDETTLQSSHDWQLDCGAATFDEALVLLARNVLDQYGDYTSGLPRFHDCPAAPCVDCAEARASIKRTS